MPTSGLSIVTLGMVYPPQEITPVVPEKPVLTAVVEVRPQILASIPTPQPASVDSPVILSAEDLSPSIAGVDGPEPDATGDSPKVLSAEDLSPRIIEAVEED